MDVQQLRDARWEVRRAFDYVRSFGAIRGVNYVPAYCHSYIQMWHWFDEAVIRREIGYAVNAGINSFRIFVGACQWQSHQDLVCKNLDRFLDLCAERGISIMLTLQPNIYLEPGYQVKAEDPFQIHFVPGGHDKGWTYEGAIFGPRRWAEAKEAVGAFVTGIVTRYGQDPRVAFWDLYNEPWHDCEEILHHAFACARAVNPMQPLTSCWLSFDLSDVVTFHCYEKPGAAVHSPDGVGMTFEDELARALAPGRPVLCTECLARTFGNELAALLPFYQRHAIGFYVWGLCAGSAQYQFPWNWPIGSPAPRRWFHCLFYPDGAPFDEAELRLIREFRYRLPE